MNLTQSSYVTKKLAEEKVFKDPIHKYVHVKDQLIWDLIKTKEFQRLRRIKQLGTLYLAFHTAEHSRFGHSLGVYEIVRRMIDESFVGREAWNNKDRPLLYVQLYYMIWVMGRFHIVLRRYLIRITKRLPKKLLLETLRLTKY